MGGLDLSKLRIVKLSKVYDLSDFDCGDVDLNDFIKNDALNQQHQLLSTTTLYIYEENVIGFFSLLGDSIKLNLEEIKSTENLDVHYAEYPAVKIGRLGVDNHFKNKGVGTLMLKDIFGMVLEEDFDIGFRFITVDSYLDSAIFYEQFGFVVNEKYKKRDFLSMRYDLFNLKNPIVK